MFRNKFAVTIFATVLLLSGLFLLYTSNINKTLFIDVSAENPLFLCEDKSVENIQVQKNSHNNYIFLLPSNFLYQTKTIYLQNTNNDNLNIKLYTEQKTIGNKNVEFSIQINKIIVNGSSYNNKKQTVWYEQPYIDTVSVKKDEVISLTVKYKTKLMLRNVFVPQFVVSIFLFLLSFIFFLKCYFGEQTKNFIKKLIQSIMIVLEKHGEWDTLFIQKYRDIDAVYKKTFWTVFIVLNIVFLYHNVHFIWGNHDWDYVINGMWGSVSWWNGRFTNYLPNQLLGGRFLPILTVSFALFGYSFTGILLAYYWNIQKTFFNYLVLSLVLVLNPLVMYWVWFAIDMISHLWLPSILILALIISEKKSLYSFIFAWVLFIFGLGIYAPGAATIATVFLSKVILVYSFEQQSFKFLCHKFKRTFYCIILSLISFKIIINILKILELFASDSYNNQMNILGGSIDNFLMIIKASFLYLFRIVPFYDQNIIIILISLSIFSLIVAYLYIKKQNNFKIPQLFFIAFLLCLLPLASNTTMFIYGKLFYASRIYFYGNIFLWAFFITLLLKTKFICAKNILILFLIFLLPMNVYRIVEAQKLWKIEFDSQNGIMERIVKKLQDSEYYKQNQPYSVVVFGGYSPKVLSFYKDHINTMDSSFLSFASFWPYGLDPFLKFFDPNLAVEQKIFIGTKGNFTLLGKFTDKDTCMGMLVPYIDILKNELKEWPSSKFVLVKDNWLFLNFNNKILHEIVLLLEDKRKLMVENK